MDSNFNETAFEELMQNRIYTVLMICSNYDFYMLEEDGRIDEQIFSEYVALNLREPPVFLHANSIEKAMTLLKTNTINLVISMLSVDKDDVCLLAKQIKQEFNSIPFVVLTPFSNEVSQKLQNSDTSAIDYIFCWLGDTNILLAIIKLIEDKMNVEHDVEAVGVQVIVLVEDSIRFYSSYLPKIYKILLQQAHAFMSEGLNENREMLLMRGRPKILLATNYEDALFLYKKYKKFLLGIISDVAYQRNGIKDEKAGFELYKEIKSQDDHVQFMLQSSDLQNKTICEQLGIDFLYKHSKTLSLNLTEHLKEKLSFGDFVFYSNNKEIARASNLRELQSVLSKLPDECIRHHFQRNDFSRWLNARALFSIAQKIKYLTLDDFTKISEVRSFVIQTISDYRLEQAKGLIAKFDKTTYDEYLIFSRIGEGSLGGKARGLAFIDSFLKRNTDLQGFKSITINIPRTLVLCSDVFDEFMNQNNLYQIALSNASDEQILQSFVEANLPHYLIEDFKAFLLVTKNPIAIRSSSLLEDSHYQPFAGIYSTFMIPNEELESTIQNLSDAIKGVYASVYYKSSKSYIEATSNLIDEEKMSIILQEVCGTRYENRFYPHISGVARSVNFYPIPPEKNSDGIAKIAFGLGKIVVEGGTTLRISPKYPKKIIQLSSPQMALLSTQKYFYALDLNPENFKPSIDETINILKLSIKEAEKDKSLKHIVSTYDIQNQILRDGINYEGKKIITFANVLKNNIFPLSEILQTLLEVSQKEMNTPIEIEFAVNINTNTFKFLQIRPIVETLDIVNYDLQNISVDKTIVTCNSALGNGIINNIYDFIYVKADNFGSTKNAILPEIIANLNEQMIKEKRNYVLLGYGRWGTSDINLGIPIKWSQISAARLIVEAGLSHFHIEPSQGTHFFQNLTSFRVGYFTINPYYKDGFFDENYLNQFQARYEDSYIRHVRFENPILIQIDGKNNKGVILK